MVTVVTVCYQAAEGLEKTIKSVLAQENCDIEFIVKDGGSTDTTEQIIKTYEDACKRKLKHFLYTSCKDGGIYDAMNTAILLSTGDWIIFMNAGDVFFNVDSLATLVAESDESDVVYGDSYQVFQGKAKLSIANMPLSNIKYGSVFCHQATIIKQSLMKELLYDTAYQYSGDYDFFLKCYLLNKKFKHVSYPVTLFSIGGVSYQRPFDVLDETCRIQESHGVLSSEECLKQRKMYQKKKALRKKLPQKLYHAFQELREKCHFADGIDISTI